GSRELAEEVGFREGVAWALHERGLLAVRRGEPGAPEMLHEALEIHRDLGDRWRMTSVLDDLAAAALTVQPPSPARAARLLGAAQRIRDAIGTAIAPCERADHARTETAARAALGEAAFADLTRAGAGGAPGGGRGPARRPPPRHGPAGCGHPPGLAHRIFCRTQTPWRSPSPGPPSVRGTGRSQRPGGRAAAPGGPAGR